MNVVFDLLMLLGAIGVFLFGMKMMSEGLQKVAGDKMRTVLSSMTSNRFKGILTGFAVTAVIQSSTATTVMIVSLVNAGLLTLMQAIGVIMGANVGTTLTAWIISLLGFQFDIATISLPMIAVGFIFLMLKSRKKKSIGELIIGFALLFMGLEYLKSAAIIGNNNEQLIQFLSGFANWGYYSVLIFVGVGTILTIILQSSTATMALTMTMCLNGLIPFEIATAMVLGENIGTTITANVAAMVANVQAKRAARAHFVYNIMSATCLLIFYYPFLSLITWLTESFTGVSPDKVATATPIALSLFHSTYNLFSILLLVGFTPVIAKIVTYLVKQKPVDDDAFRLKYIQRGILSTAELSLTQAQMEIVHYAKHATKQFGDVRDLFKEITTEKFDELYQKIEKGEEISDRMELGIATYLNKVGEIDLSEESSRRLQFMYRAITEIESVCDSNYNLARIMLRKKKMGVWFDQELRDKVNAMFDILDRCYACMNENMERGYEAINIGNTYEAERDLNDLRTKLKEEHIHNLEEQKYKYATGIIYMDLVVESEQLGDFIVNVSETIFELKHGL